MSKIQLLTERIYNKIAAGEVVERPASVLKELLENSLDAGALRITVAVRQGGEQLISVTDDGEGMDPDDAILCFEAHATSKIKTEKDLFAITSFGFRGEAMPSIASVAKVTLHTRRRDSAEGFEVVINGGKMLASAPFGCAPGTEVVVRDLFFNTPARKKFLRSRATEEKHIAEMITNISLAHPEIGFELTFDGRPFLSSPAAKDPVPRIRALFGRDYADAMIPVSGSEHGITVNGFIARRSFTRPTRMEQRIFVNGRPVESQAVYRGIREGCGPTLDKGRYQPCILFLSLDPSRVDVNVHPAKREVRFSSDYEVTGSVRSAVGGNRRSGPGRFSLLFKGGRVSGKSLSRPLPRHPRRAVWHGPHAGNGTPRPGNGKRICRLYAVRPDSPSRPGRVAAGILRTARKKRRHAAAGTKRRIRRRGTRTCRRETGGTSGSPPDRHFQRHLHSGRKAGRTGSDRSACRA